MDKERSSVLIIDDQPEIRNVLRRILERDGRFSVAEAGNVQEGAKLAGEQSPDIALIDISMPGATGLTLISVFKEITPATKIIVFSGHFEMGEEVVEMGAAAFLPKTVSSKDLLRTLEEVLAL